MLSRFIANSSRHLRFLSLSPSSPFHHPSPSSPLSPQLLSHSSHIPKSCHTQFLCRHFSNNNNNNNKDDPKPTSDFWKISPEHDNLDAVFGAHDGFSEVGNEERESKRFEQSWGSGDVAERDVFEGIDKGFREERESSVGGGGGDGVDDWLSMDEFKPWTLKGEKKLEDVFDIGNVAEGEVNVTGLEDERELENAKEIEKEEQSLMAALKGPNRAFGDLVAASGITDAMLDSLIALKNFENVDGLPPLEKIEDERYEKTLRKSSRAEIERQKQEEAAKARVRQVDEKGRAYGTGRRKCSIARVWIQPGEGKFLINDKEFDVYFPMLDQRAALLRPFSETNTLGLWDVKCTVQGGGVSGQVGAIRLGISRALQNWEPGLRPPLREAGFLTRDPRVVERKKPGKAKARKSFQWVKR